MICEFWRTLSCRLNMVKPSLLSLFSMFCQFNLLLVTPKNTIIVGETTIVIDFPRSEWWLQLCCLGAQGAQGGSGANEIGRRPHSLLSWVTTWLTRIYRQFIGVIAIVRWGNKPTYKLGVPFLKEKDKNLSNWFPCSSFFVFRFQPTNDHGSRIVGIWWEWMAKKWNSGGCFKWTPSYHPRDSACKLMGETNVDKGQPNFKERPNEGSSTISTESTKMRILQEFSLKRIVALHVRWPAICQRNVVPLSMDSLLQHFSP